MVLRRVVLQWISSMVLVQLILNRGGKMAFSDIYCGQRKGWIWGRCLVFPRGSWVSGEQEEWEMWAGGSFRRSGSHDPNVRFRVRCWVRRAELHPPALQEQQTQRSSLEMKFLFFLWILILLVHLVPVSEASILNSWCVPHLQSLFIPSLLSILPG